VRATVQDVQMVRKRGLCAKTGGWDIITTSPI